ncbi:CynX/NimT family MFS transporter [Smaragdicoccus niigatensis]|uniref:CynX/NimT family MFS transporter n=1 Tax=Smaragdicoccus niigatensis TaxID=359359 RepID=UPI000688AA4B|nr:MFS transporter [Smaragdicoccus niigatensis]
MTLPGIVRPSTERDLARAQGRALVFVAIIASALTLRTAVTSFTPLAHEIAHDIGFSTTVIGIFGMVPTAMFALAGVLTPALVRRFDLEATVLIAMILTAFGIAARTTVNDAGSMLALSAVALAGMGVGNVVIPPLVKRYFSDRVAILSSVYITMVQIGTVVPALVAVPVSEAYGWRFSIGMWSALAVAAALPWFFLRGPGALGDSAPSEPVRVGRNPLAWGMAAMFGMTSFATYAMFTWLPALFVEAGASEAFAATMLALFAFMGLVPALAAPTFAARIRNPFPVAVACAVASGIGYAGLLWAPMAAPILWVVILGLGPSTFPLALTLINLRTRTPQGSAALSGFAQGMGYLVACLGPVLFGLLHDATGGWNSSFAVLAVALIVMLAGAWQACKPRYLEDLSPVSSAGTPH